MTPAPRCPVDPDDDLRAHFDARAAGYERGAAWVTDSLTLEPIASWFKSHAAESAVELGVGTGAVPDHLGRQGDLPARYMGVDISPAMLRHAAGWTPVLADASRLPFGSGSTDVVVARQVFHYFEDPVAVLREVRRILRDDGTLIVSHIVPFDDREDQTWWARAVDLRQPLRRQILTRTELCRWLHAAGFGVSETIPILRRSSLRSWLRRYPVATGAEEALAVHFRQIPPAVARTREPGYTQDEDVTYNIRWVTVFACSDDAQAE